MRKYTIDEIKKVTGCQILNWPKERKIECFVEYPDKPLRNCLYFIIEDLDDESVLLKKLTAYGAAGVMIRASQELNVENWTKAGIGIAQVEHLTDNYYKLAKLYRSNFQIPFVQVIGSSGKTTAKEMIGSVLNAGMPTMTGYNNYNAPSGVAYNIFSLRDYHKAAVFEVGMKAPGIMSLSSEMVKPHIGVLTSIQRAHFVSLGSIENIIEAKAEMLEYLDESGVLIVNGEDDNCSKFPVRRYKGRILRYGFSDKFDLWATNIEYKNFTSSFRVRGHGFEMDCVINTFGKYNILNALAAILVALELGIDKEDIRKGLLNYEPLTGRLKVYKGIKGTTLINDNFNANPDSTAQLLEEIPKIVKDKSLMLVLGDMERSDDEIEKYARKVHYQIGEKLSKINFVKLIAIGKWAKEYIKAASNSGISASKLAYFQTVEDAEDYFKASIIPGSVIVFKASTYVPVRHLIRCLGIDYE